MDTLINAISSLIIINGSKFLKLNTKALKVLSYYLLIILSSIVFLIASKGYSVLFMFLFADLLCCAAVFPVFYGMFNQNISKKLAFYSVISGLIFGLFLFPDQTFTKSILIGNILPSDYFPNFITTALLFWSFFLATFIPIVVIYVFNKKGKLFDFRQIHEKVKNIR